MKVYLKVKILSLAAEAQIIRRETRRFPGDSPEHAGLHNHRVVDVRNESRAALLAYGFLRGRAYRRMEARSHVAPNWRRVEDLVKKYGQGDIRDRMQRFSEWKDAEPQALAA